MMMGAPAAAAADLGTLDDALLQKFGAMIAVNKSLKWRVVQRGFWANGQTNLRDYLREIERFTLDGRVEAIRCPTLLTAAENDPLAKGAQRLHDALKCPRTIARFTAAEGAGGHCEMMNWSSLNRTVLDWLDETLG